KSGYRFSGKWPEVLDESSGALRSQNGAPKSQAQRCQALQVTPRRINRPPRPAASAAERTSILTFSPARVATDGSVHMPYFDDNQPYYSAIVNGQFPWAVNIGLSQLNNIKGIDSAKYMTPKGTPFYFLGIAAFASHDYQTAAFFFDAAVAEDVLHYPGDNDQPALRFMRLEDQGEAAKEVVQIIVKRLEAALDDYRGRDGSRKNLKLDDVREHFLDHLNRPHLRTLTATFVSFLAEWDYRLQMIGLADPEVSREPFFTHLFRGCLLLESLLKEKASDKTAMLWALVNTHLLNDLRITNTLSSSSPSFEAILQQLNPKQPVETAIQCTMQTRNKLGHSLVWAVTSLTRNNYDLLAQNIATSCLHAIARLYVP